MEQTTKSELKCPLCASKEFEKDKVVLPKYGILRLSDYKANAFICKKCKHILLFEKGNTYFLGVN